MDIRTLKHLIPRGRAWNLDTDSNLRKLFDCFCDTIADVRQYGSETYDRLFPGSTDLLAAWESQFGLAGSPMLSDSERRSRLDAAWKATGGQSPGYLQDTLRGAGFDVYVHEWWVPGTEDDPEVRNPLRWAAFQHTGFRIYVQCGEPEAQCGEPWAQCGNSYEPTGYPLVNKIRYSLFSFIASCGEPYAQAGNPRVVCGDYDTFPEFMRGYTVPYDFSLFPYFYYIGAETFGGNAEVPAARKNEFESLILKVVPTHLWGIILVDYI